MAINMTDKEKIEELLIYLKSLGFEGEKLEADIRQQTEQFNAIFKVKHEIVFDAGKVDYLLGFKYDHQFEVYRLEAYKATFMMHLNINDIETAELDKQMSEIDWHYYFQCKREGKDFGQDITPVLNALWSLSENESYEGEQIQSKLICKHWPEEHWTDGAQSLFTSSNKKYFRAGEYGIANAVLAYHIASGQLDNLADRIIESRITEYYGLDVYGLLTTYLSGEPESFNLPSSSLAENGILDFVIPVQKVAGRYQTEVLQATFTRFPVIQHGVFNGIDTGKLEEQMKLNDWQKGDLFYLDENKDVVLMPYVQTIKDTIDRLKIQKETKDIAEYLQVKYWMDSFMQLHTEDDEIWKMKDWERSKQRFSLDENIKVIANLMQGRPVYAKCFSFYEYNLEGWFLFDRNSITAEGNAPMEFVEGLTKAQIETMVNMLPLAGTVSPSDVVQSILQGEKVSLDLSGIQGPQQMIVSVPEDPREQKLEIHTIDGQVIPFNFKFDPNWQQDQIQSQQVEVLSAFEEPNKKRDRSKSNRRTTL